MAERCVQRLPAHVAKVAQQHRDVPELQ